MARSRNILLRLTGDSTDARREVRSVRDEMRELSRQQATAHIDVQISAAERQLLGFRRQLQELSQQSPSVKVDADMFAVSRKIDALELRLARLNRRRVTIDVDIKRGVAERVAAVAGSMDRALDTATKGVGDFFRSIPVFGQMIGSILDGLVTLGNGAAKIFGSVTQSVVGLLPVGEELAVAVGGAAGNIFNLLLSLAAMGAAAGGALIALNAIVGALIALAGAAVALVASLAAAAAGLAALGVALAGALVPVLVVAIGLFQRFHAILQARQAREQALKQSIQEQKTAEQQRAAALEASKTAQERLAQATVDGNRAMVQSIMDLRDAQLGLQSAQLGVKEAGLNLREAQRALAEFRKGTGTQRSSMDDLFRRATDISTDPTQMRQLIGRIQAGGAGKKLDPLELQRLLLGVQRAQLNVKQAVNQTAHAEDTLGQATRKRADFVRRGISAYAPYRAALEAVRKADERAAKAQDQTSAAHRRYERALRGLTTTERGSLTRMNQFLAAFKSFAKAVSDPVFKALNDSFDLLKGSGADFKGVLTQLGTALGGVIRSIAGFLAEPRTQSAFKTLATGAADLVRQLGARGFTSFLRIMREVATSALPAVRRAARDVADWLGRIAAKPGDIHRAVSGLISQFRTWARLGGSVFGLVKDIFRVAAPQGKNLADSMRHVVDRWREWVNSKVGQRELKEFFRNAVQKTKDIVEWLAKAVRWMRDHLPSAARKAKRAFDDITGAIDVLHDAFSPVVKAVQAVGSGLGWIVFTLLPKLSKFKFPSLKDLGVHKHKVLGHTVYLPFQTGGLVPGSGSGDIIPTALEPGEFVVRRAVVNQLGLPALRALNAGRVPQAGPSYVTNHFHIPPPLARDADPDPANTAALLSQAIRNRGGLLA